jgi:RHS repeat-associated protein
VHQALVKSRWLSVLCVGLLVVALLPVLAEGPAAAAADVWSLSSPLPVSVAEDVEVAPREVAPVVGLADPDVGRRGVSAGRGVAEVTAGAGRRQVGDLPVWVELADEGAALQVEAEVLCEAGGGSLSPFGVALRVDLAEPRVELGDELDQQEVEPTDGVEPADGVGPVGEPGEAGGVPGLGDVVARRMTVVLDYSDVPLGYSAGVVDRLVLWWVDDCAGDAGGVVDCERVFEIPVTNDTAARTLTFDVADVDLVGEVGATLGVMPVVEAERLVESGELEAVAPADGVVGEGAGLGSAGGGLLLLGSSGAGSSGDFTATPLALLTEYQVGTYTGHFELSYPIATPPAFWGAEPSVALSYSSGSVDGLTADVNTQVSWVGVGWDLDPGFVSRSFDTQCEWVWIDQPWGGYWDECEAPGDFIPSDEDRFYVNVSGVGGRLVEVGVEGDGRVFRAESDSMWRFVLYEGASNGDEQGEWWEVVSPDGLVMEFGKSANSTLVVPVYAPAGMGDGWCASEPDDVCDKAWQWNLRRIIDPNGYEVEFFYEEEADSYFLAGRSSVRTPYERAAHVDYIKYGKGPGKSHHNGRVEFESVWRCDPGHAQCDTWAERAGSMTTEQLLNGTLFPDVPVDLYCPTGTSCLGQTPTFFTHRALGAITTKYWSGSSWVNVDRWLLTQSFAPIDGQGPPDDPQGDPTDPKLTLMAIQKQDVWGGNHLNPVEFGYQWRPNRSNYMVSGVSAQYMARLDHMTNELNGEVSVSYGKSHDCIQQSGDPLGDTDPGNDVDWPYGQNDPRRWCDSFPGRDPLDHNAWVLWNKWKVLEVEQEATADSPAVTLSYEYLTAPSWRYDEDSEHWTDFRGHHQVKVTDSAGVYTTYTFFTGMKGDYLPGTYPYPLETFTTSESGATVRQNEEWLSGVVAESLTRAPSGGKQYGTVTYYTWAETVSGEGTYWSAPSEVLQTSYDGSPDVTTRTTYGYYGYLWFRGVKNIREYGVEGVDDVRRTYFDYVQSADEDNWWLLELTTLFDAASGGEVQAKTYFYYDGAESPNDNPTHGNLTRTRVLVEQPDEWVETETEYHSTFLWPVATVDANETRTEYTRNGTYGFVTSQTVDPDGLDLTTTYEYESYIGRGLPDATVDDNGAKTTMVYDGHGRLTHVWLPTKHDAQGNPGSVASIKFFYSTPASGESSVHTMVRAEVDGQATWLHSWTYYDQFGRQIQTQVPYAVDEQTTHRTVVSVNYNNRGLAQFSSAPYEVTGHAGDGYVDPVWSTLDSYTKTEYDNQQRPDRVRTYSEGVQLWYTRYDYGSNWVKVTDPEGRWTRSYSNGHGQLSLVEEPTGAQTTYTYTTRGELETVTHDYGTTSTADDITVEMVYDLAGRKTSMSDPDMGDWSYEYDDAGNLTQQQDGRGTVLSFDYDNIGRLLTRTDITGTPEVLATYTYDDDAVPYGEGRLTATSAGGVITQIGAYNADGNVLSSTLSVDGASYTTTTSYTIDGKPETVTLPQVLDGQTEFLAAETIDYTYDNNGRVFSMAGDDIYLRKSTYTAEGLLSSLALGPQVDIGGTLYNTATRVYQYDPDTLRVSEIRAGSRRINKNGTINLQRLKYIYDDSGNVTMIRDYKNSSQRQCFEYDNMNRLVSAFTSTDGCATYDNQTGANPYNRPYDYDAVGNITQKGSLDDYTYGEGDAGPHAVTSVDDISFGYDANGNRITRSEGTNTVEYTYDADNRLTLVSNSADPDDTAFVYDADGARIKRTHGDDATYYIGPIEIETDGGDVAETHTIYSLGGGVTAVRVVTSAGDDGEVTFTFGDHLGSSSTIWQAGELGDTDPGVTSYQRYYPYGEPRDAYNPALPTDHTFTGQISDGLLDDGGTGLMYYGARYYDPQVGRFAAADTIVPNPANPQDLNRYAYVGNNPTNGTDPSGHYFVAGGGDPYCEGNALCGWGANQYARRVGNGWYIWGRDLDNEPFSGYLVTIERPGFGWSDLLDIASFVPFVGDAVDAGRAIAAAIQGDWGEVAINLAGVVPIPGVTSGGTRAAREGIEEFTENTVQHSLDDVVEEVTESVRPPGWSDELIDGQVVSVDDALDAIDDHLGGSYTEVAPDVYVSNIDETRMAHMTDSDITGSHGPGPHINLVTRTPGRAPGSWVETVNRHIRFME